MKKKVVSIILIATCFYMKSVFPTNEDRIEQVSENFLEAIQNIKFKCAFNLLLEYPDAVLIRNNNGSSVRALVEATRDKLIQVEGCAFKPNSDADQLNNLSQHISLMETIIKENLDVETLKENKQDFIDNIQSETPSSFDNQTTQVYNVAIQRRTRVNLNRIKSARK